MRKTFIHTLPDEPYKQSSGLNKTVQCEYHGARYHVVRMLEKDGTVLNIERSGDDKAFLESTIVDDGPIYDFFILDAETHPWEAAFLSHAYTHGEVPDFEETLPTGEKYTEIYLDGNGIVEQFHPINSMKYDKSSNVFTKPPFNSHPITKTEFWESQDKMLSDLNKMLEKDLGKYSPKQVADLTAYRDWLATAKTRYANVDHWKIPFPNFPDLG
jgi:hypothetical protein